MYSPFTLSYCFMVSRHMCSWLYSSSMRKLNSGIVPRTFCACWLYLVKNSLLSTSQLIAALADRSTSVISGDFGAVLGGALLIVTLPLTVPMQLLFLESVQSTAAGGTTWGLVSAGGCA